MYYYCIREQKEVRKCSVECRATFILHNQVHRILLGPDGCIQIPKLKQLVENIIRSRL